MLSYFGYLHSFQERVSQAPTPYQGGYLQPPQGTHHGQVSSAQGLSLQGNHLKNKIKLINNSKSSDHDILRYP